MSVPVVGERYYNLLTIGLLAGIVLAIPVAGQFLGSPVPWQQGFGLFLVPAVFFCWVFTTIRAMHLADVRYLTAASTWVNLIGTFGLMVICVFYDLAYENTHDHRHAPLDSAIYWAVGFAYLVIFVWTFFYNLRRTRSLILTINMTLLQLFATAALVGMVVLLMGRPDENEDNTR